MIAIVCGLVFGIGLVLAVSPWFTPPPAWRPWGPWKRLREDVARARIPGFTALRLVALSLGVGIVVALVILAATGAWPVALIVSVGVNPEKRSTFSIEERKAMLEAITREFPNVRITVFENRFLVHYAKTVDAQFIVRGIRTTADYEYERSMRYINSDLEPEISTVFLMPPREIAEVSSTMVKGLVGPVGWRSMIRRYLPEPVYQKILQDHSESAE